MVDPLDKSPFTGLRSSHNALDRVLREGTPSRSGMWLGRITHVWRDAQKRARISFLFDVQPLDGWPKGSAVSPISTQKGEKVSVVPRVRMLQPLFGSMDGPVASTGIVAVPKVGSIVCVAEDTRGWVIVGFYTGPIIAFDGSASKNGEYSYNPGIEEAANAAQDARGIPSWFDLDEGDIVLGRDEQRVRFANEGLLVGSNSNNSDFFRSDGKLKLVRYVNLEERAPGYLGYHKTWLGAFPAVTSDTYVRRSRITESSPFVENMGAYLVQQEGFVSSDCFQRGRTAGETPTLFPSEIIAEFASQKYAVKRETVIQPIAPPPPTPIPGDNDYLTRGAPVFDFKVLADGSFKLQSGNVTKTPGEVAVNTGLMDFEMSFEAVTGVLSMRLGPLAAPAYTMQVDRQLGVLNIFARGGITMTTPGPFLLSAATFQMISTVPGVSYIKSVGSIVHDVTGSVTMKSDVYTLNAAVLSIAGADAGAWNATGMTIPGVFTGSDFVTTMGITLSTHRHIFGVTAPAGPIDATALVAAPAGAPTALPPGTASSSSPMAG